MAASDRRQSRSDIHGRSDLHTRPDAHARSNMSNPAASHRRQHGFSETTFAADVASLRHYIERARATVRTAHSDTEAYRLRVDEHVAATGKHDDHVRRAQMRLKEMRAVIEGSLMALGPHVTEQLVTGLLFVSTALQDVLGNHKETKQVLRDGAAVHDADVKAINSLVHSQERLTTLVDGAHTTLATRADRMENAMQWCKTYVWTVMDERVRWQEEHGPNPLNLPDQPDAFVTACRKALGRIDDATQTVVRPNEAPASVADRFVCRVHGAYSDRYVNAREEMALLRHVLAGDPAEAHMKLTIGEMQLSRTSNQRVDSTKLLMWSQHSLKDLRADLDFVKEKLAKASASLSTLCEMGADAIKTLDTRIDEKDAEAQAAIAAATAAAQEKADRQRAKEQQRFLRNAQRTTPTSRSTPRHATASPMASPRNGDPAASMVHAEASLVPNLALPPSSIPASTSRGASLPPTPQGRDLSSTARSRTSAGSSQRTSQRGSPAGLQREDSGMRRDASQGAVSDLGSESGALDATDPASWSRVQCPLDPATSGEAPHVETTKPYASDEGNVDRGPLDEWDDGPAPVPISIAQPVVTPRTGPARAERASSDRESVHLHDMDAPLPQPPAQKPSHSAQHIDRVNAKLQRALALTAKIEADARKTSDAQERMAAATEPQTALHYAEVKAPEGPRKTASAGFRRRKLTVSTKQYGEYLQWVTQREL